jgi:hypothetical protein
MYRSTCLAAPLLLILVAPLSAEQPPNTLTAEEAAAGWLLLFDGETDFGWKAASDANWKVADGVILVSSGKPGLLYTTSQFGDFRLKVDFRAAPETNSGVFLRTTPTPSDPAGDCYELNIAAPTVSPFFTGSFVGRKKASQYRASDDWQTFDVTADGGRFRVLLNGEQVLEYEDPRPLGRGAIGLQFNTGQVEFRNVKLLPLNLEPMLNGKDLSGWRVYEGKPSRFRVTPEGYLSIQNGPGQIEYQREYADFCLQLEIFTGGKGLNSGVFFRSIPGEFWQGYEAQIHNGFGPKGRTQPIDCGTGGFYRRQNARRIVANDREWFLMTVIAVADHMAAWVNGYQVSDWTDTRPDDENPRKGKRLAAGTIILQGHDPTTDLLFRNSRIAALPPRAP